MAETYCRRCASVQPTQTTIVDGYATVRCATCQFIHRTEQADTPAEEPPVQISTQLPANTTPTKKGGKKGGTR